MAHPSIKRINWHPANEHTARVTFPNGKGYFPCSELYAGLHGAKKALFDQYAGNTARMTADDYQLYSHLSHRVDQLQLDGHTGKAVHS